MSAMDLREPSARVDRWSPLDGLWRDRKFWAWRQTWTASLLLVPLSLAPFLWLEGDAPEGVAKVRASTEGVPAVPGIPLDTNARVERWIQDFQTTRRDEFQDLLDRRGIYGGMIREKLRERGMPEELLYLAMIESGWSPLAESRVSAVGLWQFMGPTALQFGLRVDDYVDERRDPIRATDAALDYLEWLHVRFGSWYLAAAAYNAGPGRVERVLQRHADGRTGDEDLYWEVLSHLPRETREYVPRLIATNILANEAEELGFTHSDAPAYEYDLIFVPGGTSLASLAESLEVGPARLRELNPELIRGVTPPNEIYGVRVPTGSGSAAMAALSRRTGQGRAD